MDRDSLLTAQARIDALARDMRELADFTVKEATPPGEHALRAGHLFRGAKALEEAVAHFRNALSEE